MAYNEILEKMKKLAINTWGINITPCRQGEIITWEKCLTRETINKIDRYYLWFNDSEGSTHIVEAKVSELKS